MERVPGVGVGRLRIVVLADTSDPVWSGPVPVAYLDDEAHLYRDLFLGVVRFTVVDGPKSTRIETASTRTAVFGCIEQIVAALEGPNGSTEIPNYLGSQLVLETGSGAVSVSDGAAALGAPRRAFVEHLAAAVGQTMALVRAVHQTGSYPAFLDELEARADLLASGASPD